MAGRSPQLEFDAVRVEGALITPDYLAKVAALETLHQAPTDYGVPRGLQVRDEIGRAWRIGEAHWRDIQGAKGAVARSRAVMALLRESFGWTSLVTATTALERGGRSYPLTATAVEGRVPVVVADATHDLDAGAAAYGDAQRRRSPFGLLQEFLNADERSFWGVVTNGSTLRIVRDNASLTRPAWIEADLARIFAEQRYADFSLLWLLLHESRFGRDGAPASEAVLEQWRAASLEAGTAARDRLRDGVEAALRAFGNGFLAHPANEALRQRLRDGALDATGYHQQLLRLVYRLIFLVVSEERGLLHSADSDERAREVYRDGYGLQRLRERSARRRAYDRHDDLWDSLCLVFRGLERGQPQLALPGLGGLFAESQCPDLDSARLGNRALLETVFRLTWLAQDHALLRVNWRDMGTEELGSVYESLLELVPELHDGAQHFGFAGDPVGNVAATGRAAAGNARKLTGSYYTPDSLVQALLDTALEPVIARALGADSPERALLELSVLDPAMGSGHFLLGAARRIAGHLARVRSDGTPGPNEFRRALRDVIGHCVYGSDKNAMAVELARIALWLEAMEPGKPLAFLDHHLVHGDALLGVLSPDVLAEGIPDAAFAARTGDDATVLRALKQANAADLRALKQEREAGQYSLRFETQALAESLSAVDQLPDGTLEEVEAKQTALAAARAHEDARLRFACDSYVAAFLLPRTTGTRVMVPGTGTLRDLAVGVEPPAAMRQAVQAIAEATPFLHWPLTFAAVMARGGFDCVIGNPPWDKLTVNEKEFFAVRSPSIAASAGARRKQMIEELAAAAPGSLEKRIAEEFAHVCALVEGASCFVRGGDRYPLTGSGIVNLYALFSETAIGIVSDDGRVGLVLPSGIASDKGTAPFFRHISEGRLVSLIDFENRDALFDGVHRSTKFCLLTLGSASAPQFAFFLTRPDQRFDERRRFSLSVDDLRRLNPNTRNAPVFRSRMDAELTAKIYRHVPVLVDEASEDGNPWCISLRQGLFNMTSDSGLFRSAPGPGLVPLYEAKMIHHFDHRWATYTGGDEDSTRNVTDAERANMAFEVRPRYWVPKAEVDERLAAAAWSRNWLLGWRGITNATNERSIIAAVIPRVAAGNSLPVNFFSADLSAVHVAALLAVLCSLPLDYAARQKIGGVNLNFFIVKQLPVLAPTQFSGVDLKFIAERVAQLTCTTEGLQGWARELDVAIRPALPVDMRAAVRAELDAYLARLYGLSRDELRFVLDPHDVSGPDYPTETFRVLKEGEIRQHGEYRTRRLVLDAWDRLFGSR